MSGFEEPYQVLEYEKLFSIRKFIGVRTCNTRKKGHSLPKVNKIKKSLRRCRDNTEGFNNINMDNGVVVDGPPLKRLVEEVHN